MERQKISIVAAAGNERQIGLNGKLPWKQKSDLVNFKDLTLNHSIAMGRKTFDSIGKPLSNRKNIIISKNKNLKIDGAFIFHSLKDAINFLENDREIFIIGGEEIYKEAFKFGVDKIYLTHVDYNGKADAFFPEINWDEWRLTEDKKFKKDENNEFDYSFKTYEKQ